MAAQTLEELKAKADNLGITYTKNIKATELRELIKQKENPVQDTTPGTDDRELSDEELKKQSDAMKQRLENEQKVEEKKYSQSEVVEMMKQVAIQAAEAARKKDDEGFEPDAHTKAPKTLRLSRFMNKFIIGFKNLNNDPYFADLYVPTKDVYNEQKREFEPWVEVLFHDGSEPVFVNYLTLLKQARAIPVEIVEVKKKDASYDFGKVESVEYDGFERKGTGIMVKAKVNQTLDSYVVKLPDGQEVEVSRDVVNWSN